MQQQADKHFVQRALAEGKPVPPEVLKDYPGLQAKSQAPKETVSFHDRYRSTLEGLLDQVKAGKPGFRKKIEFGPGKEEWERFGSSYPSFMMNKYGRADVVPVLEKGLKGEKLTLRQQQIFAEALDQAKDDFLGELKSAQRGKLQDVPGWVLNKGDKIKVKGEVLRVTEATPKRVIIQDGQR